MSDRTVTVIEAEIKTTTAKLHSLKAELKEARKTNPSDFETQVLQCVQAHPQISRGDIAKELSVEADQKLTNALLALREAGKLTSTGNKRACVWSAAE